MSNGKHHNQDEDPPESEHIPWYRRLVPVRVKTITTVDGEVLAVGTSHVRGRAATGWTMWPFGRRGRTVCTEDDVEAAE